jgi:replicative DNA helicase
VRSDHWIDLYLERLTLRHTGQAPLFLPSGFPRLDAALPGWLSQDHLIILAGRPGMGKSLWAQQLAEQVAQRGHTVWYISLEMGALDLIERGLARHSGLPLSVLQTGTLTRGQWETLKTAVRAYAQWPLWFEDAPTLSPERLFEKRQALTAALTSQKAPPLGLIVVDYLQLMSSPTAANRTLEIGHITVALKRMAREAHVPVLALSQLSRTTENRPQRRPLLTDLRESGNIEQDADKVLLLYREDYYAPTKPPTGRAELNVAKNRHGPTLTHAMRFDGPRMTFHDTL